ncbi:NarK/NasA family nitrate transporter [Mycobacterium malmoense]|uniref:MFS transporter n=1 Tax=Mycobacterium malmoense TaxID=1780 RepID=A0ABX3SQG5_MYCMA|nr:nitrate/nitrite transporter [Mycobacterium malmoense]OIN81301.1 MFS transporter [Mycobacterium malmoense]ORA81462.1 MFS transporter [Mycobacterium malmoense]QZA16361.1 NarK/NasA family nitrate transporter [Mycobacterium malmoense]UNB93164.1 NarK/NasA family nitrate transporter [Mycobacterium malmoense]
MAHSHDILDWDPEDRTAWERGNNAVARRNMIWSIATDHVAFGVWTFWSVLVLFMPESVYGFSAGDKFLLLAVNTLVGALMRIPYTVGIGIFGGRNFTVAITLVLLIPAAGTIWLLANPGLPLWPYLVCAALTGLGGGNFSASMTNINAFYPQRLKGWALGLNAGGGNIGVSVVQLVGLLVIALAGDRQPYWVSGTYMVLLTITSVGAMLFMNNIKDYRVDFGAMRTMIKQRDTWVLSLLYVGSFGSFIGFSFALSQVLHMKFSDAGQSAAQASLRAAEIAFVGPLLGSLSRIYGGKLADRVGGGRVTLAVFAGMVFAAGLLIWGSTVSDGSGGQFTTGAVIPYAIGFVILFVLAGVGNGSIYKMIPSAFEARSRSLDLEEKDRKQWSKNVGGAMVGFADSVGAFGGFVIDIVLRQSYLTARTETPALWVFLLCYIGFAILTWAVYVRRPVSGDRLAGV